LRRAIELAVPWQLVKGKRNRHKRPALTIELLPAISIHDLRHAIPRNYETYVYQNDFRYPQISRIELTGQDITITDRADRVQTFNIKWVKTYFGPHRAVFICTCGRGAIRLFAHYGTCACCHCHNAVYVSQRHDTEGRKRLTACKLRLELGSLPDINEPLAPKPKWKHRKTYQRLRSEIQALEAKTRQFKKPLEPRLFAYHVN
jgi:hypothetical protein